MSCRPVTLSMVNFRFARHFEGDHTERLSGQREPFPADDIAEPNYEVYAFSLCRRPPRARHGLVPILVGRTVHHLREPKDRKGIFVRSGYSVRLAYVDDPEDPEDGEFVSGCYACVLHIRKWLLLLPLLLAALLLCLTLTLCGSGSSSPQFLSGMTGTAGAAHKQVVSVDYAAYDASVDSTWKVDSLTQDFRLSLPATCKYAKGKEGGNPIISSPSIMVDFNHDSKYSDNECVYNPAGKDGFGAFLRPGCEVNRIRLTQPVKAGTYSARTVWNSVLERDGKTPAGSTSFDFKLTVE